MKRIASDRCYKVAAIVLFQLLIIPAGALIAFGAESHLISIREGVYATHSRIVLDCKGAPPVSIGPAYSDTFSVVFKQVNVLPDLRHASRRLRGAVDKIYYQSHNGNGVVKLSLRKEGAKVKAFLLKSEDSSDNGYRVVVDVFPGIQSSTANEKSVPQPEVKTAGATAMTAASSPTTDLVASEKIAPSQISSVEGERNSEKNAFAETSSSEGEPVEIAIADERDTPDANGTQKTEKTTGWKNSVEVDVVLQSVDGDEESAKSDEYGDISQPISGGLTVDAQKDRKYFIRGKADHVGRDDQFVGGEGGRYGQYEVDLSYDKSIHRFAYGASTLYSGVGSGVMSLDDALQANVQAAPTSAETANRLNGFLSGAATGNPDVTRDKLKLGLNVFALDPFSLKVEFAHETRQGTRPFAGGFSSTQMVELFEPIDYDTLQMKMSGEYASASVYLNLSYQYSQFKNDIDTLTFDNPLIATDALFEPSSGRIDLAPDNQYHNLSFTGAYTKLPGNSQVTVNAAFGMMLQDDDLIPFTTNSALAEPALPAMSADARVNTSLYNFRLTSKPLPWMHLKGHARYFDYDNQTDPLNFSGGYVETDAFVTATAITNLPSSYSKTRAGLDLGFDVAKRTDLGLGYQYEKTDRENREVEEQEDHTYKAWVNNRTLTWLDIRASYDRTQRDIGDYNFDVYLRSGDDLQELPQLRKYDQADLIRDRIQLQGTLYPSDAWSFGASAIYGKDDFKDSPYGLVEDSYLQLSIDTTYAIADRASVNLFYSYEQYENNQRGNDGVNDWGAEGEDHVHTVGAGLKWALISDLLDLDLKYTYSEIDGNIAFNSPSGTFADFEALDDAKTYALDAKVKYHFTKHLTLSLGYLWEKFDYDDFSTEGFSFVPVDAAGNYQGALLSGTLPEDYDVHLVYTQLTFRYN